MLKLHNYIIIKKIDESSHSNIYRGIRKTDNLPVILKVLKEDYPTLEELTRYQKEYEITKSLHWTGIIKTYSIEKYKNKLTIVLEDFGGESLKKSLTFTDSFLTSQKSQPIINKSKIIQPFTQNEVGNFSVSTFLSLAIQIAESLGQIHAANIIHKDINSTNIVWNQTSGQVKIIDFGISTRLSRENPTLKDPKQLEGTLAYISPEQTGRMNQVLDYRTDLYSLGVTFYELLTGQLPFNTKIALELIHSHMAKIPLTPNQLNPQVPQVLSNLVMKLMEKHKDDRYQSAFGVKADLVKCQENITHFQNLEGFNLELAQHDFSGHFQIPQKLYGREQEIKTLLQAFERISTQSPAEKVVNGAELLLITGYSGIGKTALVYEIHKPMTAKSGYFAAGKFDQLERNTPYFAITQAFNNFCAYLLSESEQQLQIWHDQIIDAIGTNGQVLIDVIPHLEHIIGSQPVVTELGVVEAQNRFNLIFQNFVSVLAQPEHPVILFLDDLQWADSASLNLIKLMILEQSHLLILGAYRNTEISKAHPLMLMVAELQATKPILKTITLAPLTLPNITQLITEALCYHNDTIPTVRTVIALAQLVHAKTAGNPLFINEFLKNLAIKKYLTFNHHQQAWQWDLDQIKAQNITDNVVELMIQQIQHLEPNSQEILKLAACIGNQFTLPTLAIVSKQTLLETYQCLWQAIAEGFILPLGYAAQFSQLEQEFEPYFQNDFILKAEQFEYKFAHDQIQQAVYSLIAAAQKQRIHLRVGQLLLQNTPAEKREQQIFTLVDHLNIGTQLLETELERDQVAELNLLAGQKAKASAAYQPAFNYFKKGTEMLGESGWKRQYRLTLALWTEQTEAAYLKTDFAQMKQVAQIVLQQAQTPLDKVKISEIQIKAAMAQNQLPKALQTGLLALQLLGIHFPEQPKQWHIRLAFLETRWVLIGKQIEHLDQLPKMRDPHQLAIMRILTEMESAAYMSSPKLFALINFKQVYLSVKYGNESISAYVYAVYGLLLCGVLNDIKTGVRFGQLALKLLEQPAAEKHKAKTLVVVNNFIAHWQRHAKANLEPLLEAYQIGLETGDLEYAALAAFLYPTTAFIIGKPLSQVNQDMLKFEQTIAKLNQKTAWQFIQLWRQVVLNLQIPSPERLQGESYDEEKKLAFYLQTNDKTTLCFIYVNKLIFCYLFEQYQSALDCASALDNYSEGILSLILVPIFYFYDSLTRLAIYPHISKAQQKQFLKQVTNNQKKMNHWAKHAPMNYHHKYLLVEAEKARVLGHHWKAVEHYDLAIQHAKEQGYQQEEALANELAAKFWLAQRKEEFARTYMQKARINYQQWGALHKVEALEDNYPDLCTELATETITPSSKLKASTKPTDTFTASPEDTITTSSITFAAQGYLDMLDLTTVTKASQALASEIVLEKLLATLMAILIENAGAQKGFLLLPEEDELKIEAVGEVNKTEVLVLQSLPIEKHLPTSIINYVARTRKPLLLANAKREGLYTNDNYIKAHQTKSILCTPILYQNQLVGLIYLENNLMPHAFTPDRLRILTLLSTQMAISLANARFVAKLEQARQAAEAANYAKTAFLANVSHELHTPLNGILGYAQILDFDDNLNPELLHESIEAIQRSGHYLLTLIDDILDIAKIETDQIELYPNEFYLDKFLKKIANFFRQSAEEKGLGFIEQALIKLPTSIYADQKRLRQILANLLSNAVKFTQQGSITFKVELLESKERKTEKKASPQEEQQIEENVAKEQLSKSHLSLPVTHYSIRFQVEDTGIGIAPENFAKILLPFEQMSHWKNKSPGAGLGLSLTNQLVEMMGSKLHIESSLDQGSVFWFILKLPIQLESIHSQS